MAIAIDGTGTITGISVGGLNDSIITSSELANGAVTAAKIGYAGAILQVVQTVKTDAFSTSTTLSFVDITGMSASITPTSSSSKILVLVHLNDSNIANFNSFLLVRGSTAILQGDTASSRTRVSLGAMTDNNRLKSSAFNYLDSPATTSSTTYKVQMFINSGETGYINRSSDDTNSSTYMRGTSSITLLEVAG